MLISSNIIFRFFFVFKLYDSLKYTIISTNPTTTWKKIFFWTNHHNHQHVLYWRNIFYVLQRLVISEYFFNHWVNILFSNDKDLRKWWFLLINLKKKFYSNFLLVFLFNYFKFYNLDSKNELKSQNNRIYKIKHSNYGWCIWI